MSDLHPILALDPGMRYVGVALSNPEQSLAFALEIIDTSRTNLLARLKFLIAEKSVAHVVIGRPLSLRGTALPMTKQAEELAQELKTKLGVTTQLVDERLSTREAQHLSADKAGRPDAAAAALFLQTYLDRQQHLRAKL
ncbi:MAG: Holliday junction resolvase RuvX [Parcubacteria group bacterium]